MFCSKTNECMPVKRHPFQGTRAFGNYNKTAFRCAHNVVKGDAKICSKFSICMFPSGIFYDKIIILTANSINKLKYSIQHTDMV